MKAHQILIVEDNPSDAALIKREVEHAGLNAQFSLVETEGDFLAQLKHLPDVVLSDYSLPNFSGLRALELLRACDEDVPFILISGTVGEDAAVEAMKLGATDYLLKDRLARLGDAVKRSLGAAREKVERKKAEEKREEFRKKLQVLSRRLVEAQETERRVIARELHVELGQNLTAVQMNLQSLMQAPGGDERPQLRASLDVIKMVLKQVHDLALNLRPTMLDDFGLEPTLNWLTNRQAELAGLKGEVRVDALPGRLDSVIETECFRIAQEALTNVVRHSKAKMVTVELRQENGQLHLCVRDDGVGFEVASARKKAVFGTSLGLLSMEERAALAGGRLEFKSAPGHGSEVHAWFPLKWQTPPA